MQFAPTRPVPRPSASMQSIVGFPLSDDSRRGGPNRGRYASLGASRNRAAINIDPAPTHKFARNEDWLTLLAPK